MGDIRTIRICLMVNGHFSHDKNDGYDSFKEWLEKSLKGAKDVKLQLDPYESRDLKYPSKKQMANYDAVLLSGSPSDAWKNDDWILSLIEFVQGVVSNYPKIRIYGICFGSQIVGRALGGSVESGIGFMETGVTKIELTNIGKLLFGLEELNLYNLHQDRVVLESVAKRVLFGDLYLIGSSECTEVEGLVKLYPIKDDVNPLPGDRLLNRVHILTTQGHPEFTQTVIADGLNGRHTKGGSTNNKWFQQHDGIFVGQTFFQMLGVEYEDDASIERAEKVVNDDPVGGDNEDDRGE